MTEQEVNDLEKLSALLNYLPHFKVMQLIDAYRGLLKQVEELKASKNRRKKYANDTEAQN